MALTFRVPFVLPPDGGMVQIMPRQIASWAAPCLPGQTLPLPPIVVPFARTTLEQFCSQSGV